MNDQESKERLERIVYSETRSEIDFETGKITKEKSTNVVRIPREPPYIKLYIDDLAKLLELTSGCRSLLYGLVKKMDYEGIITLTKSSRERLAEQIGVKEKAVRNQITTLCKKGILRRIGTGEYEANPHLFAKGDWAEINKRRKKFKLTINYNGSSREFNGEALD